MGLISSLHVSLYNQKSSEKCFPSVPYTPCPNGVHKSTEKGLLVVIKALPIDIERGVAGPETLWWTDAQFMPYSDCQLAVSTTPFQFRASRPWIPLPKMPRGRIFLFDLSKNPLGCIHFKRTYSSALPRLHPHPLGEFIAFIESSSGVKVINLANEEVYRQPEAIIGSCKYAAVAPNGINLATICRGQGFYFLRLYNFDKTGQQHADDQFKCHMLCSDFYADRSFSDQVECKWSHDSRHLAVCSFGSGRGKLFVFDSNLKTNICTVCPDLIDLENSSASSFDFDPRPEYLTLAVGTTDDSVYIVDVVKSEIIQTIDAANGSSINCVQYNNQATMLAVAYGNVEIRIFDPDSGDVIHVIDGAAEDEKLGSYIPCHNSLSIMRLAFNFTGSLLAAGMCDGFVRVWHVPCMPSLQEFCKLKILSLIPVRQVKGLLLPEKIKKFLLSP